MKNNPASILAAFLVFSISIAHASVTLPNESFLPGASTHITDGRMQVLKPSGFIASQKDDPIPAKRFFFFILLTPDFSVTIPPVNLYFERGIARFASFGTNIGVSYNSNKVADYKAADVLIGLRACGYVIPAIAVLGDKEINSFGFDPYAGLTYNYHISAYSDYDRVLTSSRTGFVLGTRWYPGNERGFGLLAEYGTAGIHGSKMRMGITLGR